MIAVDGAAKVLPLRWGPRAVVVASLQGYPVTARGPPNRGGAVTIDHAAVQFRAQHIKLPVDSCELDGNFAMEPMHTGLKLFIIA